MPVSLTDDQLGELQFDIQAQWRSADFPLRDLPGDMSRADAMMVMLSINNTGGISAEKLANLVDEPESCRLADSGYDRLLKLIEALHDRGFVTHFGHWCELVEYGAQNTRPDINEEDALRNAKKSCLGGFPLDPWRIRTFKPVRPRLEEQLRAKLIHPLLQRHAGLRDLQLSETKLAVVVYGLACVWAPSAEQIGKSLARTEKRQLCHEDTAMIVYAVSRAAQTRRELIRHLSGEKPDNTGRWRKSVRIRVDLLQKVRLVELDGDYIVGTKELERVMNDVILPKARMVINLDVRLEGPR